MDRYSISDTCKKKKKNQPRISLQNKSWMSSWIFPLRSAASIVSLLLKNEKTNHKQQEFGDQSRFKLNKLGTHVKGHMSLKVKSGVSWLWFLQSWTLQTGVQEHLLSKAAVCSVQGYCYYQFWQLPDQRFLYGGCFSTTSGSGIQLPVCIRLRRKEIGDTAICLNYSKV